VDSSKKPKWQTDRTTLEFTGHELAILLNALLEAIDAFDNDDFRTRIGATTEEADALSDRLIATVEDLESEA